MALTVEFVVVKLLPRTLVVLKNLDLREKSMSGLSALLCPLDTAQGLVEYGAEREAVKVEDAWFELVQDDTAIMLRVARYSRDTQAN